MKLAIHQLRLEFRRFRTGLFLYLLILVGNYGVAAAWIGQPGLAFFGGWDSGGPLPLLLLIGHWVAVALIVSTCVLADSPARRDRFLAARPLPARAVLTGKALYLLLGAILPSVLLECFSVATVGVGVSVIALAALERFLLCLAIGLATAAFAAHWKTVQAFLLACAIGFATVMIVGRLVIEFALRLIREQRIVTSAEPTVLAALQGILLLAAGLWLTAWIESRRGWQFRYLVPALVLIGTAGLFVMMATPIRSFSFRPASQDRIDQLLADGNTSVTLHDGGLSVSRQEDQPGLSASYSIIPVTSGFPDEVEWRWGELSYTWRIGGKPVRKQTADPIQLARSFIPADDVPISWSLVQAVQRHLGTTLLFQVGSQSDWNQSSRLGTRPFEYLPEGPQAGQPARMSAEVSADAFSWKVAADLPLLEGARDPNGTWQIAGLPQRDSVTMSPDGVVQEAVDFRVQLAERTVALSSAPDPDLRRVRNRWRTRNRFILYLPGEGAVWFGDASYERTISSLSAAKYSIGTIEFNPDYQGERQRFHGQDFSRARLLILQAEYLGRLRESWDSPEFTMPSTATIRESFGNSVDQSDEISPADFALWFHRLEKISPDAGPEMVHAHLAKILDQCARTNRHLNYWHQPPVLYLARFVPKHLAFLLDQSSALSFSAASLLIEAIILGAEEEQRDFILDAIAVNGGLAGIAIKRGWDRYMESRYLTILQRPNSNSPYPVEKLLALGDSSYHELAFDFYRQHPDPSLYQVLRTIPSLAPRVEEITRQFWRPGRIVIERGQPKGLLPLALAQGRSQALEELFTILRFLGPDHEPNDYQIAQLIIGYVHVPKQIRGDGIRYREIVTWLLHYQPSDFVFDPVLRRFVLRTAPQSI